MARFRDGQVITADALNALGGLTGEIRMFAGPGPDAPGSGTRDGGNAEWLFCDGGAVNRSDYSDLFALIGTIYGSGNGSTTFNLPDLKGRFPVGVNATAIGQRNTGGRSVRPLGSYGGREVVGHAWPMTSPSAPTDGYIDLISKRAQDSVIEDTNLPPFLCVNFIIKT